MMKKTRNSAKARRSCRKPRRGVNPLKRGSIFGSYDPWKGTIFAPGFRKKVAAPAVEDDPGGWKATFAKLDPKKVMKRVAKELAAFKKWRADNDRRFGARAGKAWKPSKEVLRRQAKAAKEAAARAKWPVITATGKRAEQLALGVMKKHAEKAKSKKTMVPATLVIKRDRFDPKKKADSLHRFFARYTGESSGPTCAGASAGGMVFEDTRNKKAEKLPWKEFIEIAERIVQSKDRPAWMERVSTTKKHIDAEDRKRAAENKKQEDIRRKREAEQKRLAKMTPAQRQRLHEREQKKYMRESKRKAKQYERTHRREIADMKKRQEDWDKKKAISNANDKWLKEMTKKASESLQSSIGRKPTIDEVAGYVNAALQERDIFERTKSTTPLEHGWGDLVHSHSMTTHVGPDSTTTSKGEVTSNRLRFWGTMASYDKLIPGAKVEPLKEKIDEEEEPVSEEKDEQIDEEEEE